MRSLATPLLAKMVFTSFFIQDHRFGIFFMFLGNLIHFLVDIFTVSISQVSPNVSSTSDWKVSF